MDEDPGICDEVACEFYTSQSDLELPLLSQQSRNVGYCRHKVHVSSAHDFILKKTQGLGIERSLPAGDL